MTESHVSEVSRDELVFTVEMALAKASGLWPRKRVPGDHDRLKPIAAAVVDHLDLCRIRCVQPPPIRGHSTPDFFEVRRDDSDAMDMDGTGESPALPDNAQ